MCYHCLEPASSWLYMNSQDECLAIHQLEHVVCQAELNRSNLVQEGKHHPRENEVGSRCYTTVYDFISYDITISFMLYRVCVYISSTMH